MITMYSDSAMRKWNKGGFKVQLDLPNRERPMGYCDGTDEDEAELVALASGEGEGAMEIVKRILKTGREIWTLKTTSNTTTDEVGSEPE